VPSATNKRLTDAQMAILEQWIAAGAEYESHWAYRPLVRPALPHGDQEVTLWPYRDWVLEAFAANKPFDQFTREQLAGDLFPEATRQQRVAAAYNRLNMMSAEGGRAGQGVSRQIRLRPGPGHLGRLARLDARLRRVSRP
jgi:hypothetical protein